MGECTEYVVADLRNGGSDVDAAHIRRRVLNMLTNRVTSERNQYLPEIRRLSSIEGRRHSAISIPYEYREALSGLVNILLAFDARERTAIVKGTQFAEALMSDDSGRRRSVIANKGFAHSLAGRRQPRLRSLGSIVALLSDGEKDAHNLLAAYNGTHEGGNIALGTIQVMLRVLIRDGRVSARYARLSDTSKVMGRVYSLIDSEPADV